MSREQQGSAVQATKDRSIRPVLIVSKRTVSEHTAFLEHLLVGLAAEQVRPGLIYPADCEAEAVTLPAVELIRYPAFKLPVLWRQNRRVLIEQLEKFKPTVLHCLCQSKAGFTRQLARQLNLPYVLSINSLIGQYNWFSFSSPQPAKIIVPTKTIAANISKVQPRFAGKVEQVNIGTFVEETPRCFSRRGQTASMVTSHPMTDAHDFENLFSAAKHLAIDGYEFVLVLTGTGRAERQVRRVLRDLGLMQIVVIVPRLEPWRSVLAGSDIFIQPQPSETFSHFLLEAMAVGTAVAGCGGGVDDLIIAEETAVVFEPDDKLSVRAKLQWLLDRQDFSRRLARNAQRYLRENHTVSQMITGILRIYADAVFAAVS